MSLVYESDSKIYHDQSLSNKSYSSLVINNETLLQNTILHLESEKDELLSTISDLRRLIKRITVQQEQEAHRRHRIQEGYLQTIKSLESALSVSEKVSGHHMSVSNFWKEFVTDN